MNVLVKEQTAFYGLVVNVAEVHKPLTIVIHSALAILSHYPLITGVVTPYHGI